MVLKDNLVRIVDADYLSLVVAIVLSAFLCVERPYAYEDPEWITIRQLVGGWVGLAGVGCD